MVTKRTRTALTREVTVATPQNRTARLPVRIEPMLESRGGSRLCRRTTLLSAQSGIATLARNASLHHRIASNGVTNNLSVVGTIQIGLAMCSRVALIVIFVVEM
jgi:hypothetical protein